MTREGEPRPLTEDEVWKRARTYVGTHDNNDGDDEIDAASLYAGAIDLAFNPADDDASQEGIMILALLNAAQFIESLPCGCIYMTGDYPCGRCHALGRHHNLVRDR